MSGTRAAAPVTSSPGEASPASRGGTRLLLVHAQPAVQQWAAGALPAPEFDLMCMGHAREALTRLEELRPDLILVELDQVLGESRLFEAAERSERPMPVIALADESSAARTADALTYGADDVVCLPAPEELLALKVRALLRMARRLTAGTRRRHALTGLVGRAGALPLVKYCEDHKLTGSLIVSSAGKTYRVEFLGGEMVDASGGTDPAGDALTTLLEIKDGSYAIEQRALPPLSAKAEGQAAPPHGEEPRPPADTVELPEPRHTQIEVAPYREPYEVETRAENRPYLTLTSVVRRGGQNIRQTRTAWQHPLRDSAELLLARAQRDAQHERVVATIRELVAEQPPPAPAERRGEVDASLLTWALHFVVEQVWTYLGTTITTNLLHRTFERLASTRPALRHFRIGESGHVDVDPSQGTLVPAEAVEGVAVWLALFLHAAQQVVSDVSHVKVPQATMLMAHALEKVGFYGAFERAWRKVLEGAAAQ
jgi:CheY-like chemotaxis protein